MIRVLKKNDCEKCCDVINECIESFTSLNEKTKRFLIAKNDPKNLYKEFFNYYSIVLIENGNIIGLGCLDKNEIKRVYVKPIKQKSGYGRRIVESLENMAKQRSVNEIVIQSSLEAEKFYSRIGYQNLSKEEIHLEEADFIFINMKKVLK